MDSKQIRAKFLAFFEDKSHKIVQSAPIVLKNDPTLMFTNAGMNQFKDYFLGNKEPENDRVSDTQKCLRVSGKHNDLEEVGFDTYHHTMFEMLGNWSFGDYFKKEAIDWAWELLTKVYGLPEDRMYATIFEGDAKENLEKDEEAFQYWAKHLPEDRILNGSKKDNFWEMGDTGPCGPCSEIHIDLRSEKDQATIAGKDLVNQDHPLVVEIWNLVFIQFNRKADQSLENLPHKHVDTGMGFERLAMAIQKKQSNYDTDVFQPLIQCVAQSALIKYGKNEQADIAMRVVVDHLRAISFTISDGQLPSNTGAGYVIRRILRRAVRYGYTYLNFKEPFLTHLVPRLAEQFADTFPELKAQEAFVSNVIKEEELGFLRTLENGLKKLDFLKDKKSVDGSTAFELYDTYGFPLDLTMLIARENGQTVDEEGFKIEMERQKLRSKSDAKKSTGDWHVVNELANTEFLGYKVLESSCKILRYREIETKGRTSYQLVLDKTPFYAESGGQVGDTGVLQNGELQIRIDDTKKENDLIVHFTNKLPAQLTDEFVARVDREKRLLTENNHSATHLLHAALRQVLGDHVQQKGSLVSSKVLRFDFSHFTKVTDEEIQEIENIVNEKIRQNINRGVEENVPIAEAKEKGAMALFGEKYGDHVRVVTFDPNYSVELCGGTHVSATGQIGLFKILSESSIAAGVRRIEAVTATGAQTFVNQQLGTLKDIREILKQPKDMEKSIRDLLDERTKLLKELEEARNAEMQIKKSSMRSNALEIKGIKVIAVVENFPSADLIKQLSFDLKNELSDLAVLIGGNVNQKPLLSVMLSDSLLQKGLNAGEMVREMSKEIKGGGGGQAFYATAGGKDVSGLEKAIEVGKNILIEKL